MSTSTEGRRAATRLPVIGSVLLATVLLVAAPPSGSVAQEAAPAQLFTGRAQVTAVDLVIDVRDGDGRVPEDLAVGDFVVYEDGEPQTVVSVQRFLEREPAAAPLDVSGAPPRRLSEPAWSWHTVVYFDQVLSATGSIRRAAQGLAAQAGRLTDLGTVEVVIADPFPRQVLATTRSARLVEQSLLRVGREVPGLDAVRRVRRGFFDELRIQRELDGTGTSTGRIEVSSGVLWDVNRPALTRQAMFQEMSLLRDQQDRLITFLAENTSRGARSLVMVNDGYDLDPQDFYLVGSFNERMSDQLQSALTSDRPTEELRELSRTLAADGWVTLNLAFGDLAASTFGADQDGRGRVGKIVGPANENATVEFPNLWMYRPLEPLKHLAIETGGEVLTARAEIPRALERLAERVRLTYQVARLPDGKLHRVEVRTTRPGLNVKTPEWSGSAAPQALATSRARRLLEGKAETGGIPVVAAVGVEPGTSVAERRRGTLQARLDLAALAAGALPPDSTLRVTFAVALEGQTPFVRHDVVEGQALDGVEGWTYTLPVSLPPEAGRVAVVVEELATGIWGGALASRVEGPLPDLPEGRHVAAFRRGGAPPAAAPAAAGYDVPVGLLPDPKVLLLLPPPGEMVTGGARFETLVTRPGVDRVEFSVDGEVRHTSRRSPFTARLDLGPLPRPRTVEAVAYDAAGEELGRDSVVLNEGAGSFRVRFVEPRRTDAVGPVDVEADVRVPADRELDRVEISWNDERVATLYEPPFRQRVVVPPESPVGFVGATAYLADGTTAEDVVFLNGPGGDERVEVQLVELFTVVTDPEGRPMQGLTAADFRITEEERRQELAALRPGSEMALSLGLLLDSSASMAESLRSAQIAATDFLYLTLGEEDRAFFVDFDSEPRLAQPWTGDLQEVGRRVVEGRAGGYTALCDALVYSLVQMQAVRGRRALVVFSDGVGREERVGFATCLRVAQQVGVPIYVVVLDRDGTERDRAAKIEEITSAVGGRVFYVDAGDAGFLDELGTVYRQIRQELGSQYLLTYYPTETEGDDFRSVEVEVLRPGLTARTVSGYWP